MITISVDAAHMLRAFQAGWWAVATETLHCWIFDPANIDEPARKQKRIWLTELAFNELVVSYNDVWVIAENARRI